MSDLWDRPSANAATGRAVGVVFFCFVMALVAGPILLRNAYVLPPGRVIGGSEAGFLQDLLPGIATGLGVLVVFAVTRPGASGAALDTSNLLLSPTALVILPLTLAASLFLFVNATTESWYVTPSAIVVSPGWPAPARDYAWSEVTGREVSCFASGKHGRGLDIRLRLRDGRQINVQNWSDRPRAFQAVLDLTGGLPTRFLDVRRCPDFAAGFVALARQ